MTDSVKVHIFREPRLGRGDAVMCVAPAEWVASTFGGGGTFDMDGLSAVFGGCAFYRNERSREEYLGVWSARKASRFRTMLRDAGATLVLSYTRPVARLVITQTGTAI